MLMEIVVIYGMLAALTEAAPERLLALAKSSFTNRSFFSTCQNTICKLNTKMRLFNVKKPPTKHQTQPFRTSDKEKAEQDQGLC